MQPELYKVRLGVKKEKKDIKSKFRPSLHEDIFIDAKNAYIVYLHLVVLSEYFFSDFGVFSIYRQEIFFRFFCFLHF